MRKLCIMYDPKIKSNIHYCFVFLGKIILIDCHRCWKFSSSHATYYKSCPQLQNNTSVCGCSCVFFEITRCHLGSMGKMVILNRRKCCEIKLFTFSFFHIMCHFSTKELFIKAPLHI